MNNKTLLFVITGVLLLGGVFVLSKNQSKVGPASQVQSPSDNKDVIEKEDEAPGKEDAEDKDEDENDNEETTTVSVIDSGFEPNTVTVKTGTEVVWINNTSATANVSSAQHPTHLVYPPLNLGNCEPGESVSLVVTEPGSYKYHDHTNPSKFGTVMVE